jgi:ribosomal-protein-alanine N-acetyltransferase
MNIIAQTPRLIIRQFSPADEEKYITLYKNEEVTRHVSKRTEEESRRKFKDALDDYSNGLHLSLWGIYDAENDSFIGVAMLKPAESDPGSIELGYVMDQPYWGRGLATELASALVKYGFETMNLSEICACTSPENIASQNVLTKVGFVRSGNILWHGGDLPFFKIRKKK